MKNIKDFLDKKAGTKKGFKDKSKGVTKEEKRALEMQFLKPEKIPAYAGKKGTKTPLFSDSVRVSFKKHRNFETFKKYFNVHSYVENNVYNPPLLLDILRCLEKGVIQYDAENRKLVFTKKSWKKKKL